MSAGWLRPAACSFPVICGAAWIADYLRGAVASGFSIRGIFRLIIFTEYEQGNQ